MVSGLSAEEDYMANFADIVRTHVFDQYPHVADIEGNQQFIKMVRQTSILDKISKIHEQQSKKTFSKIENFSTTETLEKAIKPDIERITLSIASEFKTTLGLAQPHASKFTSKLQPLTEQELKPLSRGTQRTEIFKHHQ